MKTILSCTLNVIIQNYINKMLSQFQVKQPTASIETIVLLWDLSFNTRPHRLSAAERDYTQHSDPLPLMTAGLS